MANTKPGKPWAMVVIVIAVMAFRAYNHAHPSAASARPRSPDVSPTPSSRNGGKIGGYEAYRNCTLVDAPHNDGDSFTVRLPDGREPELRLYFVDTPESAFKSYGAGETNHQRIDEQAAEMGNITPQQAVQIGEDAKHFTLALLASHPFDIFTRWDSPYHDNRFHAFVEVKQDGKSRWLEEILVEKGYVRIHTKPADLPDGTPAAKQQAHLKDLEIAAKRAGAGVWGL